MPSMCCSRQVVQMALEGVDPLKVDDAQLALVNEIALTLLSNPVIEDFTVQVRP